MKLNECLGEGLPPGLAGRAAGGPGEGALATALAYF